jgi:type I restriction enzyme S subunit
MLADPQKCDPKFLMYSLVYFKPAILKLAISGAQRNLNGKSIKQFAIGAPPVEVQQRIAAILSAYDDLIENNTRRIAILEEMARRIYEEWFVRFRFPGHEGVRMVESELGLVPEGWPVVRLDDVLVLQRGFDLPKQDRTDGPFPIISATGASASHHEYKVKGPGVVTGRSGSLGTVMYVEGDFWPLNTTLWVKDFAAGSPLYAFHVLQSIDLAGFNSGAAVPTLNRNDVHGLPVVRPTPVVLSAFDEIVGPMIKLKRRLELKNENLRATRDFLLPKLLSGELDVSARPEPEALTA